VPCSIAVAREAAPQEIGLAEADDLDAGVIKPLIDRRGGGEEDRPDAAAMKPQRAVYRDLGLPAGDRGMVGADHHGQGRGGCGHGRSSRDGAPAMNALGVKKQLPP
jgi:hypothetical protein